MNWIGYTLLATVAVSIADLLRKLGSNLKDPIFSNLVFQIGALLTAIVIYVLFSRKPETNIPGISYAFIGGVFLSIFTTLFFKALEVGPGVSTVSPIIRIGGVLLVATCGVLLFREKLTLSMIFGVIFASTGLYLLFINK